MALKAPKDIVYVDTMNLDGETNLKEKFLTHIQGSDLSGKLECDKPNENLNHF